MRPAPAAQRWLAAWAALAVAAAPWPALLELWIGAGALLAAVLGADALSLRALAPCSVEREAAPALALGTWNRIALTVRNASPRRLRLWVHDHPPASFAVRGLPHRLDVDAGGWAQFEYRARPLARGDAEFARAELLLRSPLGLWRRALRAGAGQGVRIYPNFERVKEYARLEVDQRTAQLGIHRRPRRGEGLDFLQLREYRAGDPLRQIDWKATARIQKAISREYQEERDQQIVVLLDCSRRMHSRDGELAHFDFALDAVLLVSHVALRHGDAVGLLSFGAGSGRPERWVPPRKGGAQHRALMNGVYDLQTSERPADYLALATTVSRRIRKRALLILVSNVRDEDQQEFGEAVRMLRRRHLVLAASLRESALGAALDAPVRGLDDAVRVAATHHYLSAREASAARLRAQRVRVVDAEPKRLAVELVNGYLDIKRLGLL